MNWWTFASGVMWIGAAIQYGMNGNLRMMIVSLCYAVATAALIGAK